MARWPFKNWDYTLEIGDLHRAHKSGDMDIKAVSREVAKRLRASLMFMRFPGQLEEIADLFECADDVEEYDSALADLYDWADDNKTCWVNTFGPPQRARD